jgi:cysteine-rich repeat protein
MISGAHPRTGTADTIRRVVAIAAIALGGATVGGCGGTEDPEMQPGFSTTLSASGTTASTGDTASSGSTTDGTGDGDGDTGASGDGDGTTTTGGCVPGELGCQCAVPDFCADPYICESGICTTAPPECGNGSQEGSEQCDDGNMSNEDTCLNDCTWAFCGDGFHYVGVEECDDGNQIEDDGCNTSCQIVNCGDGIPQGGEECDDGNQIDEDACLNDCTNNVCGDAVVNTGVEPCDDGNAVETDDCLSGCVLPTCGDGQVWANNEECDDANAVSTDDCVGCSNAFCGDGQVHAGVEVCDDGNTETTDACIDCQAAFCGDGHVQAGIEECDDGNTDPNDGCSSTCTFEACMNAVDLTEAERSISFNDGDFGVEECDDSLAGGWYRFSGAAGTRIADAPPGKFACGTDSPGWMMGALPLAGEGAVDRTVCFEWTNSTCTWSVPIKAINCGVAGYVFQLPDVPQCALRYCGAP